MATHENYSNISLKLKVEAWVWKENGVIYIYIYIFCAERDQVRQWKEDWARCAESSMMLMRSCMTREKSLLWAQSSKDPVRRKTKYETELNIKSVDEGGTNQVLQQRKAECELMKSTIHCGTKENTIVSLSEVDLARAVNLL